MIHWLAAKYVWWRTGFTHWTKFGNTLGYDPACPVCRVQRSLHKTWRRITGR